MDEVVTPLRDRNAEPDADVVAKLEQALELAKSGAMREVIIYGTLTGNQFYSGAIFKEGVAMIGALETMKMEIARAMPTSGRRI